MRKINIKYFLRRWQYYIRDKDYLTNAEISDARHLFESLQRCSHDTRAILSEKYCTGKQSIPDYFGKTTDIERTDAELANKRSITPQTYRKMRAQAEMELINIYRSVVDNDKRKYQSFSLKVGDYYVARKNRDGLILSTNGFEAMIFHGEDEYIDGFECLPEQPPDVLT